MSSERKVDESKSARKPRAPSSSSSSAKKPRKKKEESEEERDEEGVAASGGVGVLVLEKKAKKKSAGGSGSKRKKAAADSDAESDAEGGAPKKKKKGASSVDTSKGHLSRAESLHEEYMTLKVDELKKIICVNNMAMPGKPQNKDRLAWQCVFGEILGAPAQLCTRCGKGKLKPKVKGEFALADVKKGVTKWTCPGYFDEEADSLAFCNKAYTDKEIKTVPFKGKVETDRGAAGGQRVLARQKVLACQRAPTASNRLSLSAHALTSSPGASDFTCP